MSPLATSLIDILERRRALMRETITGVQVLIQMSILGEVNVRCPPSRTHTK